MKLVSKFTAAFEAEEASKLLEENGIATFVSSKKSNQLGGIFTGAFHVGLWVVLDDQYVDAQRLLLDPNHKVSNKLSRTEITKLRQSVHTTDMSGVLRILFQLLIVAALFAFGVSILVFD